MCARTLSGLGRQVGGVDSRVHQARGERTPERVDELARDAFRSVQRTRGKKRSNWGGGNEDHEPYRYAR